jgi:hypothetical protein
LKEIKSISTTINGMRQGKNENEMIVETADVGVATVNGEDGKEHEIEGSSKARDVWVRTAGGWRIKYHEALETSTKVDGQAIN